MKKERPIKTNEYGNVNVCDDIPNTLVHIPQSSWGCINVKGACKALGCTFAPAHTGFDRHQGRYSPTFDGVVVRVSSAPLLQAELAKRTRNSVARKEKAAANAEKQEAERIAQEQAAAVAKQKALDVFIKALPQKYPDSEHALRDAASALFDLNRYCKSDACNRNEREEIYSIKNAFVRLLYRMGYCTAAYRHEQNRDQVECRSCEGAGCQRCEFTGNYRDHRVIYYYIFTFNIHGTYYSWHQPEDSVDFDVTLTKNDSPMPIIARKEYGEWGVIPDHGIALIKWVIATLHEGNFEPIASKKMND